MARGFADAIGLFLLPFAVYAVVVLLQNRFRLLAPQWSGGRLALLSLAGLALVLSGLVVLGVAAPRRSGTYVPAHLEDGRLVHGELR